MFSLPTSFQHHTEKKRCPTKYTYAYVRVLRRSGGKVRSPPGAHRPVTTVRSVCPPCSVHPLSLGGADDHGAAQLVTDGRPLLSLLLGRCGAVGAE